MPTKINDVLFHLVPLRSNTFTGTTPSDIAMLSMLIDLNSQRNELSGAIPKEIGSLKRLSKCGGNCVAMFVKVFYSSSFFCKISYEWKTIT